MKKKGALGRLGWLGVALVAIGGKLKTLLPLLKFGKFGGTIITMAISVGAYALLYPWQFAIGIVVMILIHEMGHVWAAKRKGLPVSAPSFIPFLGALITMKKQPTDAETEAYVALGGPLVGTAGALACYGLAIWTSWPILYVIAAVGLFLNLFNLIPIHPLDGGRIVVAVTRWLWIVGLVLGLVVVIWLRSFILGFFYLLFVWELWHMYFNKKPRIKTTTVQTEVAITKQLDYILIPGENHHRSLSFRQYSMIDTQQTILDVYYPGIGLIAQLEFPALIKDITLIKTRQSTEKPGTLLMDLQVQYSNIAIGAIQKEDSYYQVPVATRWMYGTLYIGLAALLILILMYSPHLSKVLL